MQVCERATPSRRREQQRLGPTLPTTNFNWSAASFLYPMVFSILFVASACVPCLARMILPLPPLLVQHAASVLVFLVCASSVLAATWRPVVLST